MNEIMVRQKWHRNVFIQYIMKENLLLVKDSLELYRMKYINTWLPYQTMSILIN